MFLRARMRLLAVKRFLFLQNLAFCKVAGKTPLEMKLGMVENLIFNLYNYEKVI